jgi:hypothetical protein
METYARNLLSRLHVAPEYDETRHYRGTESSTLAYVLTLGVINFGSGYFKKFPTLIDNSGYYLIASRLRQRFEQHGPFLASELVEFEPNDCLSLISLPNNVPEIQEFAACFSDSLNQFGRLLVTKYEGQYSCLIENTRKSAARLLMALSEMPGLNDVAVYERRFRVPFYKKAQLIAWDLSLAFNGAGFGEFHDLNELTAFADNLVPHVLQVDGLLNYSPHLKAFLSEEKILSGADEEIEIRACALVVVDRLRLILQRMGHITICPAIDYVLWNMGHLTKYKTAPYLPRVKSQFY